MIPLPAVASSRNEGTTVGNLTVLLFVEKSGIYRILAPTVTYNRIIGTDLGLSWFEFLEAGEDFKFSFRQSIGIDQDYTLSYRNLNLWGGGAGIDLYLTYFRDSTYRFFGLTENSAESAETNFTQKELFYLITGRLQPDPSFWMGLSQRLRWVEIGTGRVEDLPYFRDRFSGIPGEDGATVLAHRLTLTYDTRDLEATPLTGTLLTLYGEVSHAFLEEEKRTYLKSLLEARWYLSSGDGRYAAVLRGGLWLTAGGGIPFFEQADLGGEETLRHYGDDRFIDDNALLINLEGRIRVFSLPLFGVVPEFQLAPFLDMGRVFSSFRKNLAEEVQVNPGIGFRGVVRPNVVGRIDLGFGKQGTTVFVGVDFPF